MKKGRAIVLVVTVLIGLGGLTAVQFLIGLGVMKMMEERRPTPGPAWKLIYDAALEKEDLPQGWKSGGVQIEEAPGADEGRFFWFYGPPGPELSWVNVSESLLVYPTVEAAEVGYVEQRDEYFPPHASAEWKRMPELEIAHHADQMKIACLPGYINGVHHYACGAVARYDRLVVILLGNVFDDRWLIMEDFRAVLETMDRRVVTALEQ